MYITYKDNNGNVFEYTQEQVDNGFADDKIKITKEEKQNLIEANKTEEQKQAEFRGKRDVLLKEVDVLILIAEDAGQDTSVLRAYRQALRDSTKDWVLPVKP